MGYVDLKYLPGSSDLLCEYLIGPGKGFSLAAAAKQVAAESSVGTWTEVKTSNKRIMKMAARVFSIDSKNSIVKIAYPSELFEQGNASQILSSIAGNIYGMRAIRSLRLNDVIIPKSIAKSFPGPELGLNDIRKIAKVNSRPLAGTIYKPKVGLRPREMAELAYRIYSAGIDYSKDDENLGSMSFNKFEERVVLILNAADRIKSEQGRSVIYAPNITAPADEMLKRAEFVKRHGGKCIMIDVVSCGISSLQFIRKQNLKMIIHAHRAGHAAFTRNRAHGISMLAYSKFLRLCGVSALHTGTVVGKMEGSQEDVVTLDNFLRSRWNAKKEVMPIASGGLHPGLVGKLVNILGKDIIINFGGGLWGHPSGPEAGARAIMQSIDAAVSGVSARSYAKHHAEMRTAINKWGCI
jgi:ribulose-bisphosphate carboxylase large chain